MYSLVSYSYAPYMRHIDLILKGRIVEYLNKMLEQSTIDFSNNGFSSEIAEKLTELIHLSILNVSYKF